MSSGVSTVGMDYIDSTVLEFGSWSNRVVCFLFGVFSKISDHKIKLLKD